MTLLPDFPTQTGPINATETSSFVETFDKLFKTFALETPSSPDGGLYARPPPPPTPPQTRVANQKCLL